jgi:outer membrane immunogenic protein
MKKLALALTALAAFTGSAVAADLPARTYSKAPPPPVPVASWTGCYIAGGGGGGYAVRRHNDYNPTTNLNIVAGLPDADAGALGWFGTVQGGCDYQFGGNWVVGAFADYDFSDINGQYSLVTSNNVGTWKQDYSWAAGARIGYVLFPQMLTYISGGYTQAHQQSINFITNNGVPSNTILGAQTRDGCFIGAGDEYALSFLPGLFWKTEYRFSRFDGTQAAFVNSAGVVNAVFGDRYSRIDEHSVRSQLVFRFNWGGAVVAKY